MEEKKIYERKLTVCESLTSVDDNQFTKQKNAERERAQRKKRENALKKSSEFKNKTKQKKSFSAFFFLVLHSYR